MNMSDSGGMSVPAEHLPGLVAFVAFLLGAGVTLYVLRALAMRHVGWAEAAVAHWDRLSFAARAALLGVLVGAVVHAALVPTHWSDERTIALLFVADVIGFAIAAVWILQIRRHWDAIAAVMLGGTAGVYAWYVLTSREDADLVGLLTTTVELAAALVVLWAMIRNDQPDAPPRRSRRIALAVGAILVASLSTISLAAVSSASSGADASASTDTIPSMTNRSMGNMSGPSASNRPLALATTSPAGPIIWPDDMSTMGAGMQMATPNCTAQPTRAQQQAAVDLVNKTVVAAAPYRSLAAAKAAGYLPVTPTGMRIVHYINPAIYRQRPTLDPEHIPVLVYVNTPHGAVLSAAMYLMPRSTSAAQPPQPGGCLTQWHIHTDLCFSGGRVVGTDETGGCGTGSFNEATTPMMHVWLAPVAGGPLAPDPPARDEVAAASQLPTADIANGTA
jgi:hypothetical protein